LRCWRPCCASGGHWPTRKYGIPTSSTSSTGFYPALHYYLLGLLYFAYFLLQFWPDGWSLAQFAAYHFFWGDAALLEIARWTGAAFAVGTVIWAGLLGRRVAGTAAGCMAALLVEDRPLRAPLGARGIR
jgi:hypothetical protein